MIARQLVLELRKVAGNRGNVEASEDRFLGLTLEQEPECRLEAALRAKTSLVIVT